MKSRYRVIPPTCTCRHAPRDTVICGHCGHFHPLEQTRQFDTEYDRKQRSAALTEN